MIGEIIKYLIYFILGGFIVAIATYFGSEKQGLLAAFFAMFPFVTAFTLFTVYSAAGLDAVSSYIIGLLILTPVWILYLICILYLLPKYGFWISIAAGVIIYFVIALIIVLRS
ncbi:DUF3147 domain-containing protein [Methanobacterium sp.]|uniref:DUF3147 domain-containing protein n=1 Tax=Methanobacterium sp. TaxID=2164 RepID=UPI003C757CE5